MALCYILQCTCLLLRDFCFKLWNVFLGGFIGHLGCEVGWNFYWLFSENLFRGVSTWIRKFSQFPAPPRNIRKNTNYPFIRPFFGPIFIQKLPYLRLYSHALFGKKIEPFFNPQKRGKEKWNLIEQVTAKKQPNFNQFGDLKINNLINLNWRSSAHNIKWNKNVKTRYSVI